MDIADSQDVVMDDNLQFYTCQQRVYEHTSEPIKLGYRVFGSPNSDGSNTVLAPTWLGASSADFSEMEYVGPGKLLDTNRFAVIIIDALGNGISTSPTDYLADQDYKLGIEDMVLAQHELLCEHLGLNKLFALVGISMGGMQAFKWLELFPDYFEKVSTIVSAARIGDFDRVTWTTLIDTTKQLMLLPGGEAHVRAFWSKIDGIVFRSPDAVKSVLSEQSMDAFFEENRQFSTRMLVHERLAQMEAIRDFHAVLPGPQGLKTKLQYIYSETDAAVTPFDTLELLKPYEVDLVRVPTPHGHLSMLSDLELIEREVNRFL